MPDTPAAQGGPTILVFCRDYLVDDYRDMLAPFASRYRFAYVTDGQKDGVHATGPGFYAGLKTARQSPEWTDAEEDNVRDRCRMLREFPQQQALQMIRSMIAEFERVFDAQRPQLAFCQMVDEYVTHILAEICRKRGILYLGMCYSYFRGCAQVTCFGYGQPFDFRAVPEAEVAAHLEVVTQATFRQDYLQPPAHYGLTAHIKAMVRYRVKQVVFKAVGWWKRDPLNIHYACLPYVVERRYLRELPDDSDYHADWRDRLKQAAAAGRKIIYFPLAYYPESTINYWVGDRKMLQYEETVIAMCRALSQQQTVVIKEHVHMMGARQRRFLQTLRDIPNVVSVPTLTFSNLVVPHADMILIGGGSIGVEGYLLGKPVLSFCDTVYWFAPSGADFFDLSNPAGWQDAVAATLASRPQRSHGDNMAFLAKCLASTLRVARKGNIWPIAEADDLAVMFDAALNRKPEHT